ncbi:MAG: hypothetical protein HZB42_02440 [Sphingobacteriales bacterium]|nr:hypothetical protein [Sphingobacteriales bacterium]
MIANRKYLFLLLFSAAIGHSARAQIDTNVLKKFVFPLNRQLYNGYVDEEQNNILKYDGKADQQLIISANDEINYRATQAITIKTDWLQYRIETDSGLNHTQKVRYVQGLKSLLQTMQTGWRAKLISPINLPASIEAYNNCIELDKEGIGIDGYIRQLEYEVAYPVAKSIAFEKNSGFTKARNELVLKYCILHPEKTLPTLRDNPNMPFADSLIRTLDKRKFARQIYDFAQAGDHLGALIRNITDDVFIKTIARMARSRSGQQYFPFLDEIVNDKLTIEEIDSVKDDSLLYYRMLVKTQLSYVRRAINKDTAFEFRALTDKLVKRAKEFFVNEINGLHYEPAEVRFKSIQPMTAEELYYLAVSSEGSIYTSSFVKGVYPLMMKKCNNKGDSLLMLVGFDKYRKFIKMAAGYNTLGNFLSTFPPAVNPGEEDAARTLMRAFVKNLEKSEGAEDAVDVADSYASIAESLKPMADDMLKNIRDNYKRNEMAGNKKGKAVYMILEKLFLSADSTRKIDLTAELGIPPVYEVPYNSLVNDSGRVIMQVFFYGDKDGQSIFRGFLGTFSNSNWKIVDSSKWVTINSVKGKPVSIYANKPLPEEGGEDEEAQKQLCSYLQKNKLYPVVTIHRGHSYTAPSTIEQMAATSKVVFLGSCGGYLIMKDALEVSPDAHIIFTKQIGDTRVNRPFFQLLTDKIRSGNNIEWISFWKELDKMARSEDFEDYVPPHKNLGALFIKAYKIAMGEE